ncbi:MAG: DUF4175 family protein [Bacteroidales bacterium]|nr:hypothetical protein [Bacteroidales bacterium]MDZ4205357.1 DUF4175 family protein [Bacteroidales bacterium]
MLDITSYTILIEKLDGFIRKYYRHRIIRGLIYAIAVLIASLIIFSLLEYVGHFGKTIRAILYFGYIFTTVIVVFRFILIPLSKLFRIGKTLTYEQAAGIVSQHFSEIKDKLINALQLGKLEQTGQVDIPFLKAAIEQKTKSIQHIPFTEAVDNSENKRKIPLALIPVGVLVLVLILAPSVIREPAKRITNYQQHFEKPMPFAFSILNEALDVLQGDDLEIVIKVIGDQLPHEVYIETSKITYKAQRIDPNSYSYRFRNLQERTRFILNGSGFMSREFTINVYPKPIILSYTAHLKYPAYTRKSNEIIENTGDFTVPTGTKITWRFVSKECDSLAFIPSLYQQFIYNKTSKTTFVYELAAREAFSYVVKPINRYSPGFDSIIHFVNIIPDQYPEIQIEIFEDQVNHKQLFFTGLIRDDYGFDRLIFHYIRRNSLITNNDVEQKAILIPIDRALNNQSFYYNHDFAQLKPEPGDRIEYWFEVWDNDQVNGNKATRTGLGIIEMPQRSQLEEQASEKSKELTTEMDQLQKALRDLQLQVNKLQRSILEKENIGWEESRRLQDLLDKQHNIQEQIENINKGNQELNRMQGDLKTYDEELMRKQQELQKLFDEIMTDEMKIMFEEIKKMLEELDRDKMQETLRKMNITNEELSKSLDRTKELFKQLEMEKKITETVDKLRALAEKQKQLAEESKQNKNAKDEALKKQEEIQEEFNNVKKDIEEIGEKNEDLELKYDMIDTKQKEESINQSMEEGKKQIQKGNSPSAAPHQKDAGDKMENMGNELMDMLMQMQNEQLGEDIQMLRKMLENLIEISFEQENLIDKTIKINRIDPGFKKILDEQKKLKDDLKLVEDSLNALAKRQISVERFILKEIATINYNVQDALDAMEARAMDVAATKQQFIMTSVNNLALMLSEAMEQMMLQMAMCSQGGSGSCPKPGGQGKGKPSLSKMRDLQQQLNQQMQNMKDGEMRPGQQSPGQSMSEQFARMAAQQEALRRQLQGYMEELRNEKGVGDGGLNEVMKDMEQTEKDLVNKRLTNETLMRQQRIETRLLESEKAQMEREKEEKRESREAQNYPSTTPDSVLEFYKKKMQEREMLRTVPPQLKSYYRNLVNEYFIRIQ